MTKHPFPNAKPKLLGAGENSIGVIDDPAVAALSGSISQSLGDVVQTSIVGDTDLQTQSVVLSRVQTGDTYTSGSSSYSSNASQAVSIAISHSSALFGSATFNVRMDGVTVIGSISLSITGGDLKGVTFTFLDNVSGNHFYDIIYTVEDASILMGIVSFIIIEVRFTDTHSAIIVSPATATKQIITPDSHTTHESGVLS